jgi:hypothetical protein
MIDTRIAVDVEIGDDSISRSARCGNVGSRLGHWFSDWAWPAPSNGQVAVAA